MDYSVYLEIEQITQHPSSQARLNANLNRNEFLSYDSTHIYHMGLIDFLEPYSYAKNMETAFKTKVLMRKHSQISCVPPNFYKARLMEFFKRQVLETHMQDSRKIKLCDTVTDLDYFERLVKLYSSGKGAEITQYSSDKEDKREDRNEVINSSLAMDYSKDEALLDETKDELLPGIMEDKQE